jgi:hypothetical protein
MRTFICRCKHCGKEYHYQASGEGCHDRTNNRDYCPECMEAILEALDKIPKKYEVRFKKIERPEPEIIEKFKALVDKENKYDEEYEKQYGFKPPRALKVLMFPEWVKSAAEFSSNFVLYRVESPSDDLFDENAHWFRQEEYDILEHKFTDKLWKYSQDNYMCRYHVSHYLKSQFVVQRNLSEPLGKLFFDDLLNSATKTKNCDIICGTKRC